jgi:hypothetical protein
MIRPSGVEPNWKFPEDQEGQKETSYFMYVCKIGQAIQQHPQYQHSSK